MTTKKLALAAFEGHTPGPWRAQIAGQHSWQVLSKSQPGIVGARAIVQHTGLRQDAELIAAAPALLAECRRLQASEAKLREALEAAELSCTQARLANGIGNKTQAKKISFLLASFELLATKARAALAEGRE